MDTAMNVLARSWQLATGNWHLADEVVSDDDSARPPNERQHSETEVKGGGGVPQSLHYTRSTGARAEESESISMPPIYPYFHSGAHGTPASSPVVPECP